MTAKRVFLFFLLLLICSTSNIYSYEDLYSDVEETNISEFEFEEETTDLYQGTIPFSQANFFQGLSNRSGKSLGPFTSCKNQSEEDYFRRSKVIDLDLDIPAIIFPFHVFL